MRFPPNLKYFFLLILLVGITWLAVLYIPRYVPNATEILVFILSICLLFAFFFVIVKPFFTFLYARADGIFEVYVDQSEKGIHIFSYHINSGGEYGDSTRDVQHYFVVIETGKIYFKRLFSHSMEPASGRSGWGDFYSFEESVLQSKYLPESLKKLSAKSGIDLKLGRREQADDDNKYTINQDEYLIEIKKYDTAVDEGVRITCTIRNSGKLVWKKRI